VLINKEIV